MVAKLLPKLPMHPNELERELKEAHPDIEKFPLDFDDLGQRVAEIQKEITEIDTLLSDAIQIVVPYLWP
jgi:hypothetical protein